MNKQNQKDILAAYLEETLANKGVALDEKTLNLINENIQLKERPLPENEQRRLLKLSEDTSGQKKATSIKLTNLMELSIRDILSFIAKEVEILLFSDSEKQVVYALFMLLFEFSPNLKFIAVHF
ncbi:MAG: hypothetical protein ACE362_24070 [Phaeodactylibacter xiamenensis]|uniref:Uncharacterized protein n=1 Tax=Phaeodactylibacter xiamenensis TaxID=1524460 RepID=A0A098S7A6_9BACT|nr:hypothetical protein [Phaeodactylibacter xiamenensis]KGE87538.1 hypothetical protein IX84_15145 [Phaeodactylibacter xiamenensis]MCR9053801.1 hypothetical protein [bacterium]